MFGEFDFKKNLNYFFENFKIMLKILKEYKFHIYFAILNEFTWHITMICIFFFSINQNFGNLIGWNFVDFVLFILLAGFVSDLCGIILWQLNMINHIKSGAMNMFLLRPINPIISYNLGNFSYSAFVAFCIDIVLIFSISIFFNVKYYNIVFGIFILISIILYQISLSFFIKSIPFYSFGLGNFFIDVRDNLKEITITYPSRFFDKFSGKFFLYLSSYFFVGSLLIPMVRNLKIVNFWLQFCLLIFLIIFFTILTLINWKIGLKKYEAFG